MKKKKPEKFHQLNINIFKFNDYIQWLREYNEIAESKNDFYKDYQNRISELSECARDHFNSALHSLYEIALSDIPELTKALLLTKGEAKYLSLLVQLTLQSNSHEKLSVSEEKNSFRPIIYEYDDHQEYFLDLYRAGRKDKDGKLSEQLSYAQIAEEIANIRTSMPGSKKNITTNHTFFRNVIKGLSRLSASTATELAIVFRLPKEEALYLNKLVEYNRLRINDKPLGETKQKRSDKMEIRKQGLKKELEILANALPKINEYSFLDKWYYGLVRELLRTKKEKDINDKNISSLVNSIAPGIDGDITKQDILKAIDVLRATKQLEYDREKGIFFLPKKLRKFKFSPSTAEDEEIMFKYHEQIVNLLFRSIRAVPRKHRFFKTAMLSISNKNKKKLILF
jgi:uncharacterized protein (TIGR02147 family)